MEADRVEEDVIGEVRRRRRGTYSISAVPWSASLRIPDSPELSDWVPYDIAPASFLCETTT
jgi:hypothetical protein